MSLVKPSPHAAKLAYSPTTGIHLTTSDHAQISPQFFKVSPLPRPNKITKVSSDRTKDLIFSQYPVMHTIGVKLEMLTSSYAHNRKMKERKISQASLENLKLGAIARRKGKQRVTLTLLPDTIKWLKKHDADGNMSECVDEVVRRIVAGELARVSVDKPS